MIMIRNTHTTTHTCRERVWYCQEAFERGKLSRNEQDGTDLNLVVIYI